MHQETLFVRQIIADNIREGRQRLGLTQVQFAEVVEFSVQTLSALENGLQFAKMDTYCRIAESLSLPIHMLFYPQQSQDETVAEQLRVLLFDCEVNEKRALLNILKEIRALTQKNTTS